MLNKNYKLDVNYKLKNKNWKAKRQKTGDGIVGKWENGKVGK
jgi:hypothetical protein